jgi:hypothetical protein
MMDDEDAVAWLGDEAQPASGENHGHRRRAGFTDSDVRCAE